MICSFCSRDQDIIYMYLTAEGLVCYDCLKNLDFLICPVCGEIFYFGDRVLYRGRFCYICNFCIEENFETCESCGYLTHREELIEIEGPHGVYLLCKACYEQVEFCSNCGEMFLRESMYFENGEYYCKSCYEELFQDRWELYDYNYKPNPIFHDYNNKQNPLFLGIELETDNYSSSIEEVLSDLYEYSDSESLFYCKKDGSLDYGLEIVSHPCSLEFHLKEFPWREIFSIVKRHGGVSHDSGTCGLHIHVNRDFLGKRDEQDSNIAKILFFVEKNFDEIKKFSRRTWKQIERWCDIYGINNFNEAVEITKEDRERYYAVNLQNEKTIEFRIFRGTLRDLTFFATLELVHFLVKYCKSLKIDQNLGNNLKWSSFINYVKNQKIELVKELITYLNEKNLM